MIRFDTSTAATAGNIDIYTSASGTADATITSTQRMIIEQGGNVGIGTTSPVNELEVAGTINATAIYMGTNNVSNINYVDIQNQSIVNYIAANNGSMGSTFVPYTGANSNLDLGANNLTVDTSVLAVDSTNDRVGIGTASPIGKFEVKNNDGGNTIRTYSSSWADDEYNGFGIYGAVQDAELGSIGYRYHIDGTSNSGMQIGTSTSAKMTVLTSGNVGIGTDSPVDLLNVYGGDINLTHDNPTLGLYEKDASTYRLVFDVQHDNANSFNVTAQQGTVLAHTRIDSIHTYQFGGAVDQLQLVTDDVPRLFVETGGEIGIGTTTPTDPLNVVGDINATGTFESQVSAGTGTANNILQWAGSSSNSYLRKITNQGGSLLNTDSSFILSAGDSGQTYATGYSIGTSTTSENLHLVADGGLIIATGMQGGYSNRMASTFTNTGALGINVTGISSGLTLDVAGKVGATAYCDEAGLNCAEIDFITNNTFVPYTGASSNVVLGANNLTVDTSVLVVDVTNDRVGIGTTSPAKDLTLSYSSSDSTVASGNGLGGGTAGSGLLLYNEDSTTNSYVNLDFRSFNADGRIAYQYNGTTNYGEFHFITDQGSNYLNAMMIDGNGNVGIGTTSPGTYGKLEVTQTSDTDEGGFSIADSGVTRTLRLWVDSSLNAYVSSGNGGVGNLILNEGGGEVGIGDTDPDFNLEIVNSTTSGSFAISATAGGDGDLFVVDESGNVGIGTSSPIVALNVISSNTPAVFERQASGINERYGVMSLESSYAGTVTDGFGAALYFAPENDNNEFVNAGMISGTLTDVSDGVEKGALYFFTKDSSSTIGSGDLRMTLDDSGNLGIGTTGPNATFEVINGTTQGGFMVSSDSQGAGDLFIVDESGNVGIGTTSPGSLLEVKNDIDATAASILVGDTSQRYINISSPITGAVPGRIQVTGTTNGLGLGVNAAQDALYIEGLSNAGYVGIGTTSPVANLHLENSSASSTIYQHFTNDGTGSTVSDGLRIGLNSIEEPLFWNFENTDMKFANNNDVKMVIKANGFVGINDPDPTDSWLEIKAAASTENVVKITGSDDGNLFYFVADSDDSILKMYNDAGTKNIELKTNGDSYFNGGNVGIGTTTPTSLLDVAHGSYVNEVNLSGTLFVNSTAGNVGIGTSSPTAGYRLDVAGAIIASTGEVRSGRADRLALYAPSGGIYAGGSVDNYFAGNVGIGTTDPAGQLHVTGQDVIFESGAGNNQVVIINRSGTGSGNSPVGILKFANKDNVIAQIRIDEGGNTAGSGEMMFYTTPISGSLTERMRINSTGEVGIGTDNPDELLHVHSTTDTALKLSAGVGDDVSLVFDEENSGTINSKIYWDAGDNDFRLATSTGDAMSIDGTTLNVGIGTISPNGILQTMDGSFNVSNAGNASLFVVDNTTGFVGIGTASPSELLSIEGTSPTTGLSIFKTGGTNVFKFETSGDAAWLTDASNGVKSVYLTAGGGAEIRGNGDVVSFKVENTAPANVMRLTSEGYVGIGTTAPVNALEVSGTMNATAIYMGTNNVSNINYVDIQNQSIVNYIAANNGSMGNTFIPYTGATSNVDLETNNLTIDTSVFAVDVNNNRVGIGTSTPETELHIYDSGNTILKLESGNNPNIQFANATMELWEIMSDKTGVGDNSHDLRFYNPRLSGSTPMIIEGISGNVGIGVTDPQMPLEVAGNIRLDDGAGVSNAVALQFTDTASRGEISYTISEFKITTSKALLLENTGTTDITISPSSGNTVIDSGNFTVNTNTLYVDSNNDRVGISTSSPDAKVEINSSIYSGTALMVDRLTAGGVASIQAGPSNPWLMLEGQSTTGSVGVNFYSSGDVILANAGGNVGIGTSIPQSLFQTMDGSFNVSNTGNASLFIVDNTTGFVGIGTATPSQALEVYSTIKIGETGVQGGTLISGDSMIFNIDSDDSGTASSFRFKKDDTADSGTELMRIQENGYVGIGTDSPGTILDIEAGDVAAGTLAGSLRVLGGSSADTDIRFGASSTGDYGWIEAVQTGVGFGRDLVLQGQEGEVGIGMTAPTSLLHVYQTQSDMTANVPLVNLSALGAAVATKGGLLHLYSSRGTGTDDTDLFKVAGGSSSLTTFLTIRNSGLIGIGTSSPAKLLHLGDDTANINGEILFEASDGDLIDMGITTSDEFYIGSGGGYVGNVGIGTTNPSAALDVIGAIEGNGAITATSSITSGGPMYATPITTFADGDATPSIALGNIFQTANTASTAITDFDDPKAGHSITIIFGDSDTNITNIGNIRPYRNLNRTAANAWDSISFVYNGTFWIETSFSDNS